MKRWADMTDSTSSEDEGVKPKTAFNLPNTGKGDAEREAVKRLRELVDGPGDASYRGPPVEGFDDSKTGMNKRFKVSTELNDFKTVTENASNCVEDPLGAKNEEEIRARMSIIDEEEEPAAEPVKNDSDDSRASVEVNADEQQPDIASKPSEEWIPNPDAPTFIPQDTTTPTGEWIPVNNLIPMHVDMNGCPIVYDPATGEPVQIYQHPHDKMNKKRVSRSSRSRKNKSCALTSENVKALKDQKDTEYPPLSAVLLAGRATVSTTDNSSMRGSVTSSTVIPAKKKFRKNSTTAMSQLGDEELDEMINDNNTEGPDDGGASALLALEKDIQKKKSTIEYQDYLLLLPKEERKESDPTTPKAEDFKGISKRHRKFKTETWMHDMRTRVTELQQEKGIDTAALTERLKRNNQEKDEKEPEQKMFGESTVIDKTQKSWVDIVKQDFTESAA